MTGEILSRNLAVAMHQYDQRLLLIRFKYQCLDDSMLVDAQLLRRLARPALLNVLVNSRKKIDLPIPKESHRARNWNIN